MSEVSPKPIEDHQAAPDGVAEANPGADPVSAIDDWIRRALADEIKGPQTSGDVPGQRVQTHTNRLNN